jgi:hypothetical protein
MQSSRSRYSSTSAAIVWGFCTGSPMATAVRRSSSGYQLWRASFPQPTAPAPDPVLQRIPNGYSPHHATIGASTLGVAYTAALGSWSQSVQRSGSGVPGRIPQHPRCPQPLWSTRVSASGRNGNAAAAPALLGNVPSTGKGPSTHSRCLPSRSSKVLVTPRKGDACQRGLSATRTPKSESACRFPA